MFGWDDEKGTGRALSGCEVAALNLRAEGLSHAEIAERLSLRPAEAEELWRGIGRVTGAVDDFGAVIKYLLRRVRENDAGRGGFDGPERRDGTSMEGTRSAALGYLREGVVTTDLKGTVTYYNPRFAAVCGLAGDSGVGRLLTDLVSQGAALEPKIEAWGRGLASHIDLDVTMRDGRSRWLRFCGAKAQSDDGSADALVVTVLDVTSRRRLDKALQQSQHEQDEWRRRLDAALDVMPLGVAVYAADGQVVRANRHIQNLLGQKGVRIPGNADLIEMDCRWAETGHLLRAEEWPARRLLAGVQSLQMPPISLTRADGPRTILSCSGSAVLGPDGSVEGAVMTAVDVTDEMKRDTGLGVSEARLVEVVETLGRSVEDQAPDDVALPSDAKFVQE